MRNKAASLGISTFIYLDRTRYTECRSRIDLIDIKLELKKS